MLGEAVISVIEHVSPEFRLRPSLSALSAVIASAFVRSVAGVQTPAFVERSTRASSRTNRAKVSPEFRLRPSLSGPHRGRDGRAGPVSPEFRLRPS